MLLPKEKDIYMPSVAPRRAPTGLLVMQQTPFSIRHAVFIHDPVACKLGYIQYVIPEIIHYLIEIVLQIESIWNNPMKHIFARGAIVAL